MAAFSRTLWRDLFAAVSACAFAFLACGCSGSPFGDSGGSNEIRVTPAVIDELRAQFVERTGGDAPTIERYKRLVERHIETEILYRYALSADGFLDDAEVQRKLAELDEAGADAAVADGVHLRDPQVRTILAAKARAAFMAEAGAPPTDAELQACYRARLSEFQGEERRTVEHLYIGAEEPDADVVSARIAELEQAAELGDRYAGVIALPGQARDRLQAVFGSDFARAVFTAPKNVWRGPVRSSKGVHLLRITEVTPGRVKPLHTVRAKLLPVCTDAKRNEGFRERIDGLRSGYTVTIDWGDLAGPIASLDAGSG